MIGSAASDTRGEVLNALEHYLRRTAPAAAQGGITAETPLLGSGLLDSLSMLELTMFLSDEFGIELEDEDFTTENFETAGRVAALIAGKLQAAA